MEGVGADELRGSIRRAYAAFVAGGRRYKLMRISDWRMYKLMNCVVAWKGHMS